LSRVSSRTGLVMNVESAGAFGRGDPCVTASVESISVVLDSGLFPCAESCLLDWSSTRIGLVSILPFN